MRHDLSSALDVRGEGWYLRLATDDDNAALCHLFRSIHLKSALDLTQERDPDFFVLPRLHQPDAFYTVVGIADGTGAEPAGQILGCGTIVVRPGWFRGAVIKTGYLCDLRIVPDFRGGIHLARAYGRVMDWVARRDGADIFTTVIFDSNRAAIRALTTRSDKRKDQPVYRPMTPFHMTSVQFTTRRPKPTGAISEAAERDVPELVQYLDERARAQVFGEVFSEARFRERLASWPGLAISDFVLARGSNGRIVGCLAPWDTSSFKRTRVLGYHGKVAWIRRFFNVAARVRGFAPLPRPGDPFRFVFLTHLEIDNDDPAILRDLLLAAYARFARSGFHFMSAFVPRGSPLEKAFDGFTLNRTAMTLYAVHAPEGKWQNEALETRHPGFEMALS